MTNMNTAAHAAIGSRVARVSATIAEAGAKLIELGYSPKLRHDDSGEYWAPGNTLRLDVKDPAATVLPGVRVATVLPQYDGTARVALYTSYIDRRGATCLEWVSGGNYKSTAGIVRRIINFVGAAS